MATTVTIVNTKGGVGKTTLSINLAAAFHLAGKKVLLIDHDVIQGSASRWKRQAEEAGRDGYRVVSVESDLSRLIKELEEVYDIIVVDGPPRIEKAATTLVAIADIVLIPIQPSTLDIWACEKAIDWIQERQIITGGKPEARFVMSRVNPSSDRGDQISGRLADTGIEVMNSRIVQRQDFERVFDEGKTVFDLRPSNKARLEINAIYEELLNDWKRD